MTQWLLLMEGRSPSRPNMERDLGLFGSVLSGRLAGALRLYNWDEPAVTVGYHQKNFSVSEPGLAIPVVKRPTGGGAVLHFDDLTFSISAPEQGLFSRGIDATCEAVSEIFARALKRCGIEAEIKGSHTRFSDVCFLRSSPAEISVGGFKAVGLALLRSKGCFLLQGVLPLRTDPELSRQVFGAGHKPFTRGIIEQAPWFQVEDFTKHLIESFELRVGISFFQGREKDGRDHDQDEGEVRLRREQARNNGFADK